MLRQKLARYTLSPQNIICYLIITLPRAIVTWWSTCVLRCKALLMGITLGKKVTACGEVIVQRWPDSHIFVGDGATLLSSPWRGTACTIVSPVRLRTHSPTAQIILAEGVQLSGTSITARSQRICVGKNTMIAPNCVIVDADFHAPWPAERRHIDPGFEHDAPVTIGQNVWVGMHCIILKGVTIGDGAVIGAGSVVTRDIPAYAVAAGTPARVIQQHTPDA